MKPRDVVFEIKYWVKEHPLAAKIIAAVVAAFILGWFLG